MSKQLIAVLLIFVFSQGVFAEIANSLEPEEHEGYDVKEGKIYFRRGDAGLILEVANGETVAKYYSDRGINLGNPFASLGGDMQTATIFLLTILNRTNGNVNFTPRYVTLKIKTEAYFPIDFTELLAFTEGQDKPVQKILQNSVYHSSDSIPAGKIISKFLIFAALPKKFDELKLIFDYLYFENNEVRTTFYYKRKKNSEN